MQKVKLETRMPYPHILWYSRCWGPRALEMLWGPALP